MSINEKYPVLFGHSLTGNRELHNTKETAEFICEGGEYGDVSITDEKGIILLTTFGIYIDKILDLEYREELLKELEPLQKEIDGENTLINGGTESFIKALEEKSEAYVGTDIYNSVFEELARSYIRQKIDKTDEEIKSEVINRFKTQCIKEAQNELYKKFSEEAEEYTHTDQFQLDMQDAKYKLEMEGETISSDFHLTDRLKEIYIEQKRREVFCEENGHSWRETNPDPENGRSDLDCECCGEHHNLQWL